MNVYFLPMSRSNSWTPVPTPYTSQNGNFEQTPEKVLADWDGYIDPEGNFYGTRPTGMPEHNFVDDCHEQFALEWLAKKYGTHIPKLSHRETCKDAILRLEGWVSCTFAIASWSPALRGQEYISIDWTKGGSPSQAQTETLRRICELRGKSFDEVFANAVEAATDTEQ
jgi:hypothetical protein